MSPLTKGQLGNWRRIRRWAVPPTMVREATAARLAGDWRAACSTANVDVAPGDYTPFEDDLRHFAPDLLRWHLPRKPGWGDTHLDARQAVHLAGDGPALYVGGTRLGFGSQRLRLFVTDEPLDPGTWDDWEWDDGPRPYHALHDYRGSRQLWDARESGSLLAGCGWTHLPGFDPAGNPLPQEAWGVTERVLALHDAGRFGDAWAAAGADIPEPPVSGSRWSDRNVRQTWEGFLSDHVTVLAAARTAARSPAQATGRARVGVTFGWNHVVQLTGFDGDRLRGEWVEVAYQDRNADWHLDPTPFLRPVDADLVRTGTMPASWLHPLVHAAFFPAAAPVTPADAATKPLATRVRCGGEWHRVGMAGGRFDIPHSDEERHREQTLRALGGDSHGCFAAEDGWRDGRASLPRALADLRRDLMLRAQHGDRAGVVELLDAGVDPHARDPHGRSLLHHISGLMSAPDDLYLFWRLVESGLDVEARDRRGSTPLQTAVYDTGSAELVRAFLAAGAKPDAEDDNGVSVADVLERFGRPELQFLQKVR